MTQGKSTLNRGGWVFSETATTGHQRLAICRPLDRRQNQPGKEQSWQGHTNSVLPWFGRYAQTSGNAVKVFIPGHNRPLTINLLAFSHNSSPWTL